MTTGSGDEKRYMAEMYYYLDEQKPKQVVISQSKIFSNIAAEVPKLYDVREEVLKSSIIRLIPESWSFRKPSAKLL